MRFTHRALEALKPSPDDVLAKRYREHFADGSDEPTPGLAVRVAPTGRRTFTFHYTFDGKRTRMDLGTFPAIALADARNRALDARRALESEPPLDPRDVRQAERVAAASAALTVGKVIELYLADPDIAKLRSWINTARSLRSQVARFIGDVAIDDLTRRQLVECLDRIRQRGAATYAGQVHKNMRLCFEWAVGAGHMESNPMAGIPKPQGPEKTGPKIRPLNDEGELAAFWNGIRDALPEFCRDAYSRILKLALLTGCRISEIAEIKPGEICDGVLTIPGERTKNKKPQAIPLNAAMLELIGNNLDDPWGLVNDLPVTGYRISDVFSDRDISKRLGSVKGYNIHSLRRTFATGLDELGIPESTIRLCLNHSKKRKEGENDGAAVTQRYIINSDNAAQRKARARMELKRAAFDEWTRCVLETVVAA
jgi:integrase